MGKFGVCWSVIKHSGLGLLFAPIPPYYKNGAPNAIGLLPNLLKEAFIELDCL